jgi:hypothetical protein
MAPLLRKCLFLLAAFSLLSASTSLAQKDLPLVFHNDQLVPKAKSFLGKRAREVQRWTLMQEVLAAVTTQNRKPSDIERIKEIDAKWSAGLLVGLPRALMTNDCAAALRRVTDSAPSGYYREAFVTDAQGALVCTTERTSDYWQADEEKWLAAFNDGHGALYVGPVEQDESVNHPLVQIAVPVMDGNQAVGVLVVGKLVNNLQVGQKLEQGHPSCLSPLSDECSP